MKTLVATNNPATLNFAEAVLNAEDIPFFVMDQHQSIVDGSIGVIPRRLCVLEEDYQDAVAALKAAELGHEIYDR